MCKKTSMLKLPKERKKIHCPTSDCKYKSEALENRIFSLIFKCSIFRTQQILHAT